MRIILILVTTIIAALPKITSGQSAIGQLENITGQKINRYNTSSRSSNEMDAMITGMIAQSILNSIFSPNTRTPKVQEVKVQPTYLVTTIPGEQQRVEQALKVEKYNRLMRSYKFLKDTNVLTYTAYKRPPSAAEKKAACVKAQKEINRLTTLKQNFQKQIASLEQWSNDLDGYKKEFIQKRDSATEGIVDNVLDVLPVDLMKLRAEEIIKHAKTTKEIAEGARLLEKAKKLEETLSKTKMLNASTQLLIKNTQKEGLKTETLDQVLLTNENFTQTGVLTEELATLAPDKYQEPLKYIGKTLQVEGGTLKTYDDLANQENYKTLQDYFNAAGKTFQNALGVAGLFCPLVRITTAGEQIVEKTAYAAISEYAIHQMSTSAAQNAKAQAFLKLKIREIDEKIKAFQTVTEEYRKLNPSGCPVEE